MKFTIIVILAIVSFFGTLAAALALTGNLNLEAFEKLMQGQPEVVMIPESPDTLAPWAEAMKRREEVLAKREADVAEREARLDQERRDLEQYGVEVEANLARIEELLHAEDATRGARLKETAKTLEAMKPDKAAETMATFDPEESAQILSLIKDRNRGKILDSMDPDQRALVLRAMQEPRV
jgi:flagellar motility protein MotE (MotC chaperone)